MWQVDTCVIICVLRSIPPVFTTGQVSDFTTYDHRAHLVTREDLPVRGGWVRLPKYWVPRSEGPTDTSSFLIS